jgi:hypothetical protein
VPSGCRCGAGEPGVERFDGVALHEEMEYVALLADQIGRGQVHGAGPGDGDQAEAVTLIDAGQLVPGPRRRQ